MTSVANCPLFWRKVFNLEPVSYFKIREMINFDDNIFVHPDYADDWYIRKVKVAPDNKMS